MVMSVNDLFFMNPQNFQLAVVDQRGELLTNDYGETSFSDTDFDDEEVQWIEFEKPDEIGYEFKVVAHIIY